MHYVLLLPVLGFQKRWLVFHERGPFVPLGLGATSQGLPDLSLLGRERAIVPVGAFFPLKGLQWAFRLVRVGCIDNRV